jgi:hypothetical protein
LVCAVVCLFGLSLRLPQDLFDRKFVRRARLNVAALALERQSAVVGAVCGLNRTHPAISPLLAEAFATAGCKFVTVWDSCFVFAMLPSC